MNEFYFEALIAKYLANESTKAEENELMEWVKRDPANQIAFDELKMIWEQPIHENEIDFSNDKNEIWEKIDILTTPSVEQKTSTKLFTLFRFRNIAATLALLAGLGLWWYSSSNINDIVSIATQDIEKEINLPDGSQIVLNANSTIEYKMPFDIRDVTLNGEAFFDIARDEAHPFSIHSNGTLTQVLGTSFNIRAYADETEVEVTVSTGKVAFSEETKLDKVILTPGNTGIVNLTEHKVKKIITTPNEMAWKTKELIFEDSGMRSVLKTLNRYYNIDVDLENQNINNCHFTGHFKNAPIDEVINAIAFAMDLKTEKNNNRIVFKGIGCE